MKNKLNRRAWLAALVASATLATSAGIAAADNVLNDVATSHPHGVNLVAGSSSSKATVKFMVEATGGDAEDSRGENCNIDSGESFSIDIATPNGVIATPSTLTFTSCGIWASTELSAAAGASSGDVTVSVGSTNTTGSPSTAFNMNPAKFNVTVATASNTAPSVSVSGVTHEGSYSKGSVPAATCQVTDAEDGNSSFAATLSSIIGTYSSDGIGSQTASCSYTDGGGLSANASATYSIVDPSAPSISYTLNPAASDGSNGWYKSNVSLTWTVTESESPNSLSKDGCVDQSITSDQVETIYNCSATSAGGSTGPISAAIKRDATAPVIEDAQYVVGSGTAGSNGWFKSAVSNRFTASDVTSGLADAGRSNFTVSSGTSEGENVKVASGSVSDNAGNSNAGIDSAGYKIDLSDPTDVQFAGGPAADSSHYFGSVPAAPTCTAEDAVSGLASCVVTGHSTATGTHTMTATATDKAGRTATATRQYTVLSWQSRGFYSPVDMNGVVNTVKGGSTVPLKFEVFAAEELTNTSAVTGLSVTQVVCEAGATVDDIEVTLTGGTSLRYDTTGGQFIYNWQTPKTSGKCYRTTVTLADGGTITANFKTK